MDLNRLSDATVWGPDRKAQSGFFNRYNTPSMETEFRRAVGEIDFDEGKSLLVEMAGGRCHDLNYSAPLPRLDHTGAVKRRQAALGLVANFRQAKAVILTLGLTEAWFHKPSGLYCNAIMADVLRRFPDDFEFRVIGYDENMRTLENIRECITRHHETKITPYS